MGVGGRGGDHMENDNIEKVYDLPQISSLSTQPGLKPNSDIVQGVLSYIALPL